MELLLFLLISYGLTHIVVYGAIFEPLRQAFRRLPLPFTLNLFLDCPACVGFWAGIATGGLSRFSTFQLLKATTLVDYLFLGAIGSVVGFLISGVMAHLLRRVTDEKAEGLDDP